jgi:surface carbohydrate biosynthesis protein
VGQARICLIVDNPLRDLEGLVLLGWRLAQEGATAYLVPMYDQGFDVPALAPDLVLANYARANNSDLLKSYKRAGVLVGILDTEGIGGKHADEFAELVSASRCGDYVDLYCLWGNSQHRAFLRGGVVPADLLRVTGCPRYDYCAKPWRRALASPRRAPRDYVLINTNFPTANPRFSRGPEEELKSMLSVGFERSFAQQFIADGAHALLSVIGVCERLGEDFPALEFVLRPHPFENLASYHALAQKPNFQVRQEGTSLEWIAPARLLLHQNCSTAIEAMMLGVEPLALEWFNTPTLRVPAPSGVSRPAQSYAELVRLIKDAVGGRTQALPDAIGSFRNEIVAELYCANDGMSCDRASEAILSTIRRRAGRPPSMAGLPRASARGRIAGLARAGLGYRWGGRLRRLYSQRSLEQRRLAKAFTLRQVSDILERITTAIGTGSPVVARAAAVDGRASRLLSGATIELARAG